MPPDEPAPKEIDLSISIMKLAWDTQLPPPEKLLLISLSDQANDEGIAWPSVASIVCKTGMSERSIYRHLLTLENEGHISRETRLGSSTVYHVHPCQIGIPTPAKLAPTPANLTPPPLPNWHPTPATVDTLPLPPLAPTPATVGRQNHQEPSIEPSIEPTITRENHFDRFWLEYPKKTGKGAALKSWIKLKSHKVLIEQILVALAWQKKSLQWTRDGGQYIPNPSTYLNQHRWLDEPPKVVNNNLSEVGQRGAANMIRWLEQEGFSEDQIFGGVK